MSQFCQVVKHTNNEIDESIKVGQNSLRAAADGLAIPKWRGGSLNTSVAGIGATKKIEADCVMSKLRLMRMNADGCAAPGNVIHSRRNTMRRNPRGGRIR